MRPRSLHSFFRFLLGSFGVGRGRRLQHPAQHVIETGGKSLGSSFRFAHDAKDSAMKVNIEADDLRSIVIKVIKHYFAENFVEEQRYVPEYELTQIASEILQAVRGATDRAGNN
jgi:hypothetical protein